MDQWPCGSYQDWAGFKANMTLQSPQQLNVAVRYGIFYKTLKWERLTEKQVKSICAGCLFCYLESINEIILR